MLDDRFANLEAQISRLGTQVADVAHTNKNLEEELVCTKANAYQQCDNTANEALELACKIFQPKGL